MSADSISIGEITGRIHAAIITVRPDEYDAVEKRLGKTASVVGGHNAYEYVEIQDENGSTVRAVITRCVRQGNASAQAVATNIIHELDPQWLFLVGIAGGVPDTEYCLGDVIITSALHDFSFGSMAQDGTYSWESGGGSMHPDVVNFLQTRLGPRNREILFNLARVEDQKLFREHPLVPESEVDLQKKTYGTAAFKKKVIGAVLRRFPAGKRPDGLRIHAGPGANGNLVLKNTRLLEKWRESARQVVAVETELAGVFAAAATVGRRSYPILAVRGLSDIVGFSRDPDWTQYACDSAATMAVAILKSGFIDFGAGGVASGDTEVKEADSRKIKSGPRQAPLPAENVCNSRQTIPNNLPVLPHFFGRVEELKKIANALKPAARTWGALIDGPGGMGKTSLAIRAAELAPIEDFDRILFLTAKNREMTPDGERRLHDFVVPGYLEMLSEMGRLLKLPGITEKAEEERATLIQSALAESRVLLILDNLESLSPENRDRLYIFLTNLPATCKAIVTSRRRTDLDARIIRLEKLDHDAALAYLNDLSTDRPLLKKATDAERENLYSETGGNPLLIRWLAGQLGRGQCRTIAAALVFLRSAPPNNDPLEFIFGDLIDTFAPTETSTLSALTFFTLPVEVEHLAKIADLTPTACRTALEDLTGRSLVVADTADEHYLLTPLLADFLRKARPEIVAETGNRLEERAYALIMENGYSKHGRFPLLETAWPTVTSAIPLFIAGKNERLQHVCGALNRFLHFAGRWDELLLLSRQAEVKAVASGDSRSAGDRAYWMGFVHNRRGEADDVMACAERAEAYLPTVGADAKERASALRLRAWGQQLKGDYPAAIDTFREVLELQRILSAESRDVAISLSDLARVESLSGDFVAADRDYREALRVARVNKDAEGIAHCSGGLASVAMDREDWPAAETLALKALPLSEKLGLQALIAHNCYCLAKALVRQGKSAESRTYALRSIEKFARLGSPELINAQAILKECEVPLSAATRAPSP